ncbi:hypothetical protein H0A73_03875 [Alcaligenaceae bacterium]|nr:hypothetical protein [Alcaligenaceae bacterium]
MKAERASETSSFSPVRFHLVSKRIDWTVPAWLVLVALAWLTIGNGSYALLSPYEARHAGIVHDMWAARQYVMPRVDGLPVLDGAPLYYWASLGFLCLFGSEEWVLRLPSALSAALMLGFMANALAPWPFRLGRWTLAALFLMQPVLMVVGRFASPDMFNILLLTVAVGSFHRASAGLESGCRPTSWLVSAWGATALLGLGAGPLAMLVPLVTVFLWLGMRRRLGIALALCRWPGSLAVVVSILLWLWLVAPQYSGMVLYMLEHSALAVLKHEGTEHGYPSCGVLVLAGCLPLLACLYRYRDPVRRQAACTPLAGLMLVWLLVLAPLHSLVAITPMGHAAIMVVPLLYFGVLALAPGPAGGGWRDAGAWCLYAVLAVAVGMAGAYFHAQRVSIMLPVIEGVVSRYQPLTDKVILLDRYDYEFSFYMQSPKLVHVAADWTLDDDSSAPSWKKELLESAQFAPDVAQRLLLTHEAFLERLCERRVVNLWVIGSEGAAARHSILSDLTEVVGTGKVRAWYLDAGTVPAQCSGLGLPG